MRSRIPSISYGTGRDSGTRAADATTGAERITGREPRSRLRCSVSTRPIAFSERPAPRRGWLAGRPLLPCGLSLLASIGLLSGAAASLVGQEADTVVVPVTVDQQGVMRWASTGDEVALFGANYTAPFAYSYRAIGALGVDRKQAIDADVAHFARLGMDAYRIHVWDREVSDRQGNLLENDHLDLLDYVVARLAERGIKVILTPIAWWGTGYPERDPPTDGLSDGFRSKGEMTTREDGWPAQENYLRQFVTHRNPYTGTSYAEDPNLIAVEIFNEPNHPGAAAETTRYIDTTAGALRDAGFRKPIFYNISEGYTDGHGRAVCAARIDGVSHQWYPTGLVRNGMLGGNMLPNVDRYTIPYADFPECRDKARMVYEFDAADVGASHMYPAMARSFRAAGFQWATQFAYDPLAIAWSNTEYQTHFLNLVYTPSKAVSFMIAGAAFRQLPRGGSFPAYPGNATFGPFRVSYEEDLSEMVTDTAFMYSNSASAVPPSPAALRHVAGVGSSPVVRYEGTGAYFLDRVGDGVWRLEVYPDVAWVVDPFTRPSLAREAARIVWRTRPMRIALPDLGDEFSVEPVNPGNAHRPAVADGAFDVRPGAYLLTRSGAAHPAWTPDAIVGGRRLGEFVAPPASEGPTVVLHTPLAEVVAGRPFAASADIVSREPADSAALFVRRVGGWGRVLRLVMKPSGAFGWEVEVPVELVREGLLEYAVAVYDGDDVRTFPDGAPGDPYRWDFTGRSFWRVPVVAEGAPVLLFDAGRDRDHVLYDRPTEGFRFRTDVVPGSEPERLALSTVVDDLAASSRHVALRTFLTEPERTRLGAFGGDAVLRVQARAVERPSDWIEVGLVQRDGTVWGAVLDLTDTWEEVAIPLSTLRRVPLVLLPRPYPQFLPYFFESAATGDAPDPAQLDGLQFSLSADLYSDTTIEGAHGFEIERVILERGEQTGVHPERTSVSGR